MLVLALNAPGIDSDPCEAPWLEEHGLLKGTSCLVEWSSWVSLVFGTDSARETERGTPAH